MSTTRPSRTGPKRLAPQPVIYRSSSLQRADPELVATANPETIASSLGIQNANKRADAIRDSHRIQAPETGQAPLGNDEQSNAKKYERRLHMNRRSAAASRLRREAYTKALEVELLSTEDKLATVMQELEQLKQQNNILITNDSVTHPVVESIEDDRMDYPSPTQTPTNPTDVQPPEVNLETLFPITPQQSITSNIPNLGLTTLIPNGNTNGYETPEQLFLPVPEGLENFLNPDPSRILTEERLKPLLDEYPDGNLPASVAEAYIVGNEIPDCFKLDNGEFPSLNGPDDPML